MKTNSTLATLAFYAKHSGQWHTYKKTHRPTFYAIKKLKELGYVDVDFNLNMAKFTGKTTH
jgi:hypothetical protein